MPTKVFQPGHSGRPQGTRNKLQGDFLRDLSEAWARDGADALKIMIKEEPSNFVRVVASLMPKEFILESVTSDLDDEQIDELIAALRQRMLEARSSPPLIVSPDGVRDDEPRH
jgi:hypothetical protein